jgi:hypothetical protein
MKNSSRTLMTPTTVKGEPRYLVSRGSQVKLELTYENNGRSTFTDVKVSYYVSTIDLITTSDREIGSRTISSLGRSDVMTDFKTLTIPSNLDSGRDYWIGAVINPTSSFGESLRTNNATYVGIRTK